jgi:Cu-Zn family superoxide dismutase
VEKAELSETDARRDRSLSRASFRRDRMKITATMAVGAVLALAACVTTTTSAGSAGAQAEVREPGGRLVARSTVSQSGDSLRVRVAAAGLAPGAYGAHIHTTGRCDAPSFDSAGPHWNPTGRQHGRDNPAGRHLGDLPNLMVGTNGRGDMEFTITSARLAGGAAPMLDSDGAAVVIHARADDYRTDPSGNSGARIACGVFR